MFITIQNVCNFHGTHRFHLIGLLLLALLDIGDVVLELSKIIVYFKDRSNRIHPVVELLANFCFAIFTFQQ